MRRIFMLLALASLALSNAGCLINAYSSNPNRRMVELLTRNQKPKKEDHENTKGESAKDISYFALSPFVFS